MTETILISVAAILAWLLLTFSIPLWRRRYRLRMLWASIILGVPILGGLTLYWGPIAGVSAFALGIISLRRFSQQPRKRGIPLVPEQATRPTES